MMMMMMTLKIVAAIYVAGVVCMFVDAWRSNYPLMLKRRGRNRPHWSAWADMMLWPIWLIAGGTVVSGHYLGEFADWVMRQADHFGERLMNPVFDFIDPPLEPSRGQRHDAGVADHE